METCPVCLGSGLLLRGRLPDPCPLCCDAAVDKQPTGFTVFHPPPRVPTTTPVFLLAGQSNMVGRGDPRALDAGLVERLAGRVFICYEHDRNFGPPSVSAGWVPLARDTQYSANGGCRHFGPEFTLADGLLSQYSSIHFIKFAMGSTNLHTNWSPAAAASEGSYFAHFTSFVRQALAAAPQPAALAGMFWLQGESDSGESVALVNAYEDNLIRLVTECRAAFGEPSLPFVASPIVWKGKKRVLRINTAIKHACASPELHPARCSSLDLQVSEATHEDGHLNSEALLLVGDSMACAFKELACAA